MMYRVRGAILIGIFLTSIICWPRPTAVTYFPHTASGDQKFDFFKKVVTFHGLQHVGNAIDVSHSTCPVHLSLTASLVQLYQWPRLVRLGDIPLC